MLENMTTEMWIGVVAFLAGLVLIFGAAFRKQAGWKFNPVWSGVIGVVLVVFGFAGGVYPMLPAAEPPITNVVMPSVTVDQPTFHVDVANGTTTNTNMTTVQINDAETIATVLLETSGSGGDQPLVGTHFSVNFSVSPIPPAVATADTLATIYFETDYLMKYDGEYVLAESGGTYYANWSYAGGDNDATETDYAGSMTMLMTETGWCQITYDLDTGSSDCFSAELDTIGESASWDVTLHNADWSWSYQFTVTWILVEQ